MARHEWEKHTRCEKQHCPICDGGLAVCKVCNGAEGSLTTDCCQRPLTAEEQDDVYAGKKDFVNSEWVNKDKP